MLTLVLTAASAKADCLKTYDNQIAKAKARAEADHGRRVSLEARRK
jgi:hypothetical protein